MCAKRDQQSRLPYYMGVLLISVLDFKYLYLNILGLVELEKSRLEKEKAEGRVKTVERHR